MYKIYKRVYQYIEYFGLLRGLWVLANLRLFGRRGRVYSIYIAALQRVIYLRRKTSDVYVFQELILGSNKKFITDAIKADISNVHGDVIDGGANIGISTLLFALSWPNKRVCAVECSSENVEILKRNVKGLPNIIILEAAIWNTDGYVAINNKEDDYWSFSVSGLDAHKASENAIQALRIITIIKEVLGANSRVAFLKLDIEGAEREVFLESDNWKQYVARLLVELHERKSPGCINAFKKFVDSAKATTKSVGEYIYVTTQV